MPPRGGRRNRCHSRVKGRLTVSNRNGRHPLAGRPESDCQFQRETDMKTIYAITAFLSLCLPATFALALEKPSGDVILTVSGHIEHANVGDTAQFDLAMLEKLTARTGQMETPWTTGRVTFSGPLLKAVLDAAGADGQTLTVKALNDYSADVPIEDARTFDTILATKMNGKPMSVRDKGPLFLIYPFDENPDLYNEKYFSRSVWQIREIEVR